MGNSLSEQLLKSGLVDEKRAKKAKKNKYKQQKQRRQDKTQVVDEAAQTARQKQAEAARRDRELNHERKQAADRKSLEAGIRQLIENNRQPRGDGEVAYNFADKGVIKRIFVTEDMHAKLGQGRLAIVTLDEQYEIVAVAVAEKIRDRDEGRVILCHQPGSDDNGDDPYADYAVPDDLIW